MLMMLNPPVLPLIGNRPSNTCSLFEPYTCARVGNRWNLSTFQDSVTFVSLSRFCNPIDSSIVRPSLATIIFLISSRAMQLEHAPHSLLLLLFITPLLFSKESVAYRFLNVPMRTVLIMAIVSAAIPRHAPMMERIKAAVVRPLLWIEDEQVRGSGVGVDLPIVPPIVTYL